MLVRSLGGLRRLLVVRLGRLRWVPSRIRRIREVIRGCKASRVWMLLGILGVCLLSSLSLRWEYWVGKGRGRSRIVLSSVLSKLFAQVEVEAIAVVVVHLGRLLSRICYDTPFSVAGSYAQNFTIALLLRRVRCRLLEGTVIADRRSMW